MSVSDLKKPPDVAVVKGRNEYCDFVTGKLKELVGQNSQTLQVGKIVTPKGQPCDLRFWIF